MSAALATIHIAKKDLGLDDDTYRAVAVRITGKSSARDMSEGERGRLLEEFRRQGFNPEKKGLQGRFAAKLQALWIDGYNLGVIDDRRDAALLAFVKRQTKIDHTRFLVDATEAAKVVEALKDWFTRAAGVDWRVEVNTPYWQRQAGAQVALAQWHILFKAGVMADRGQDFRSIVTKLAKPLDQMTAKDWPAVMNELGKSVREVLGR